jgi:trehalose-6-phosphatase
MIFIQFDGTLAPCGYPNSVFIATPQRTVATLTDLTDDAANDVYVLSSRMPAELARHFRHVMGMGLIAENGCLLRKPQAKEWTQLVDEAYTDT